MGLAFMKRHRIYLLQYGIDEENHGKGLLPDISREIWP
jgi:hypothetical protein